MNKDKRLLRHRRYFIPPHFIHEFKTIGYVINKNKPVISTRLKIEPDKPVKPVYLIKSTAFYS